MDAVPETRLSVVDEADPLVVMMVGDRFCVAPANLGCPEGYESGVIIP